MIISKLIAARIAYGVDRAVQANAGSPTLVAAWDLNVAAHVTWLRYVTNWQQKGASPALDAGGIRDDSFAAVMAVVSPRRVPGQIAGRTVNFALDATTFTIDVSDASTHQITESGAVDFNGDAVSSEHYTYVSGTPAHATVSSTGLVSPVAAGTSVITVTSSSGVVKTATVTVTA
jgi:hypothetical protein